MPVVRAAEKPLLAPHRTDLKSLPKRLSGLRSAHFAAHYQDSTLRRSRTPLCTSPCTNTRRVTGTETLICRNLGLVPITPLVVPRARAIRYVPHLNRINSSARSTLGGKSNEATLRCPCRRRPSTPCDGEIAGRMCNARNPCASTEPLRSTRRKRPTRHETTGPVAHTRAHPRSSHSRRCSSPQGHAARTPTEPHSDGNEDRYRTSTGPPYCQR